MMTEQILKLSTVQLYEVYNAMWREFVVLHEHACINPCNTHAAVIERVRLSRTATAQVCDMIEAMAPDVVTTDKRYLMARAQVKIEDDYGVLFAATRHGASFVMADFSKAGTPYDLSKIAPFAFPVPPSFGSRPSNEVLEIAQLAIGLHGKDFAMLTKEEQKRFEILHKIGRKYGLMVSVEVLDDSDDIQAEIAAASTAQQAEIYRRLRTEVAIRWLAID